jgi:hypothetical protein
MVTEEISAHAKKYLRAQEEFKALSARFPEISRADWLSIVFLVMPRAPSSIVRRVLCRLGFKDLSLEKIVSVTREEEEKERKKQGS